MPDYGTATNGKCRIERVGRRETMGNDLTGNDLVTHVCRVCSVSGQGEPGNERRGNVTVNG